MATTQVQEAKTSSRKKERQFDRCSACGASGPSVQLAFNFNRKNRLECDKCRNS